MSVFRLKNFGEKIDQHNAIRIFAQNATWTEVNCSSRQSG